MVKALEPTTVEFTINLHKRTHDRAFKKRAPIAVKAIKNFAIKNMGTQDVRLDPSVNKFVWSQGVRNVPFRIRVRCARKRNEDDEAKEEFYTIVSHVPVESYKTLTTKKVTDEE
eukprot:GCRY01000026.1.p1 GENE.GCRY01000026.1~~GCRY01000026.1.p1  ORF type:complete len:130 (+),score=39.87 GCRY01000026.1:49-390(+)